MTAFNGGGEDLSAHAKKGLNCLDCHQVAQGQKWTNHNGFVINEHVMKPMFHPKISVNFFIKTQFCDCTPLIHILISPYSIPSMLCGKASPPSAVRSVL